ncbi:MAG: hypothetical protein QMC67_17110 [Candidatus Wallbacteria bacterium]
MASPKNNIKIKKDDEINKICIDCRQDCKQSPAIAILSCPQKIQIDEQLTLFDNTGKPKKFKVSKTPVAKATKIRRKKIC